jgi:hypothetical protein
MGALVIDRSTQDFFGPWIYVDFGVRVLRVSVVMNGRRKNNQARSTRKTHREKITETLSS